MKTKTNVHFVYEVPEVREVSKNLPDTRGVVFPEYEPVASHGDPIQARFSKISNHQSSRNIKKCKLHT